jgi:hypothetical protein
MRWRGRWRGAAAVCMASGPSLAQEDIDQVEAWREPGKRVAIVTNTTFKKAPWADALFAYDMKWWRMYIDEVKRDFHGERVSCSGQIPGFGVTVLDRTHMNPFGNSGAAAISLAILAGCTKVILLGYDSCKGPAGEVHHHGDHPKGLGNAFSMHKWAAAFEKVAQYATVKNVEVVNCSRRTALKCFPQVSLEEALKEVACQEQ